MGGNVKILIIDNLTETFNGALVKSGLQRSSKLKGKKYFSNQTRFFWRYYSNKWMFERYSRALLKT